MDSFQRYYGEMRDTSIKGIVLVVDRLYPILFTQLGGDIRTDPSINL